MFCNILLIQNQLTCKILMGQILFLLQWGHQILTSWGKHFAFIIRGGSLVLCSFLLDPLLI